MLVDLKTDVETYEHMIAGKFSDTDNMAESEGNASLFLCPSFKRLLRILSVKEKEVQASYIIPESCRCAFWSPTGLSPTDGSVHSLWL